MERGASAVRWLANKAASFDLNPVAGTTTSPLDNKSVDINNDGSQHQQQHATSQISFRSTSEEIAREREKKRQTARNMNIQRKNMLYLLQLIVRQLIESALDSDNGGRQSLTETQGLSNLFAVLERIIMHNFRPRLTPPQFLSHTTTKRDIWAVMELLASTNTSNNERDADAEFSETLASVRDFPEISTALGRVRACLRIFCMQKKLPLMFARLIERRPLLQTEYYDAGAMLIEDEASLLQGILVSLNFIDFNFCIKQAADALDNNIDMSIDLVPYLKVRPVSIATPAAATSPTHNGARHAGDGANNNTAAVAEIDFAATFSPQELMDQKNYLEEHNKVLKLQIGKLEQRVRELLPVIVDAGNNDADAESNKNSMPNDKVHTTAAAAAAASEIADSSALSKLRDEYNVQIMLRQELDATLKSRNTELHDKKELISGLRKQLDDLKQVNIEMFHKLQSAESALQHKQDIIRSLETRMREMAESLKKHGSRLKVLETERQTAEEQARKLAQQLAHKDLSKTVLETDLKLEQDQRQTLNDVLDEHKNKLRQLQAELTHIRGMKDSYNDLQKEHENLRQMFGEQESALADLGTHLRHEKLRNDEYKEWALTFDPASMQWERDSEVTHCRLCGKAFSKLRRKHHCRSCGGIFCGTCSENLINLPGSAGGGSGGGGKKPVRCCDACYVKISSHTSAASLQQHVASALTGDERGSSTSINVVGGAGAANTTGGGGGGGGGGRISPSTTSSTASLNVNIPPSASSSTTNNNNGRR